MRFVFYSVSSSSARIAYFMKALRTPRCRSFFKVICIYFYVLAVLGICCSVKGLLSSCSVRVPHCGDSSYCRAQALGARDFSSSGTWA